MAKYQGKTSSYELKIDNTKQVFHAQAAGFFSAEDGKSFLNDYNEMTKSIPNANYTLVIDAPELKPSSPEVAQMLGTLLERYMAVPFKKRLLVTKGNPVTISQFKRLGNSIPGWTESIEYIDQYN